MVMTLIAEPPQRHGLHVSNCSAIDTNIFQAHRHLLLRRRRRRGRRGRLGRQRRRRLGCRRLLGRSAAGGPLGAHSAASLLAGLHGGGARGGGRCARCGCRPLPRLGRRLGPPELLKVVICRLEEYLSVLRPYSVACLSCGSALLCCPPYQLETCYHPSCPCATTKCAPCATAISSPSKASSESDSSSSSSLHSWPCKGEAEGRQCARCMGGWRSPGAAEQCTLPWGLLSAKLQIGSKVQLACLP